MKVPDINLFIRQFLKSLFGPLTFLIALILIVEEWLWTQFNLLSEKFAQLSLIRQTESLIKGLTPWPSLLILCLPSLMILPIKIVALHLLINGHKLLGLALILLAKLAGTAIVARLFKLTKQKVLTIPWILVIYSQVSKLLDWARRRLHETASYKMAKVIAQASLKKIKHFKGWLLSKF